MQVLNVAERAPKPAHSKMRINPEIKAQVEQIYEKAVLPLRTQLTASAATNNVGGLCSVVTQNSQEALLKCSPSLS